MERQTPDFESIFHIHDEGSDTHSETPAQETTDLAKETLGIERTYAGIHFRDPANPEREYDTEELLKNLEQQGVNPGVEFNLIQDESGWRLDLTPEELRKLKERHKGMVATASIHAVKAFGFTKETDGESAPEQSSDEMLNAYRQIIEGYGGLVDAIGHPFQYTNTATNPEHIAELAQLAGKHGIALEINAAQMGLKQLVSDENFRPSVEQITQWNPVLRSPDALAESGVNLVFSGDFHGSTAVEKKLQGEGFSDSEAFQDSALSYQALRLMAASRRYLREHNISSERVVNTWDEETVVTWLSREVS